MKNHSNMEQNFKKNFLREPRKFTFKSACIISIISILAIALMYGVVVFFAKNSAKAPEQCVNCHETGKLDYEVNLSQNQDYLPQVLQSRMSYVSSLIESVTIKCNYHLSYDRNLEHTCKYKILADFNMIDRHVPAGGDSTLASFTDELYSSDSFLENSKQIDIEKIAVLPYSKYNEMAGKFAEKNGVVPEVFVTVRLVVDTDGKSENIESLARKSEISLKIPLYEKTIDIDETYSKIENKFTVDAYILNVRNVSLGIICLLLAVTIIFMGITLLKSYFPKHENFACDAEKIFKNYRHLLIEISESDVGENIDLRSVITHRVESFEDLATVAQLLRQPIKYYKIKLENKFCFVIDNAGFEKYVYTLKN